MYGIFFRDFDKDYIGHIVAECFVGRIYDQFLKPNMTILEVGANIGIITLYLSKFTEKLYAMEPSKNHLEVLNKTIEYNKLDNVTVIPKALDAIDGEKIFYHNDQNSTMCSLKQTMPNSKYEKVSCISISSLMEEYKINHIDFMKLDIEGSEIDVLRSESFKKEAKNIDSMMVEYHSWGGSKIEVEKLLLESGYNIWMIGNPFNSVLYGARR